MIRYRSTENGVERIETGRSTSIRADVTSRAWREFLAWQILGNAPEPRVAGPFEECTASLPRLWIIGAGAFGREIFSMTTTARGMGEQWQVAGFLNDLKDSLDGFDSLPAIAGGTDYLPQPNDVFICAIGAVGGRRSVCEKFLARGARFINIINRTTLIAGSAQLGHGLIVEAFTGIAAGARIGDFSTILSHVSIAHDVVFGCCVQVSPFASVLGGVEVGDEVLIGSHAVILPKIRIGAGSTIGAGSVVIQNVPAGATVFGVPARQIK